MEKLKVVKVDSNFIEFEQNIRMYSDHEQNCCESHYLSLEDLSLSDFEGLEFDLTNDNFFNRIDGYGIELVPIKGYSVKIPGYGYNNGYYSSNLSLILDERGVLFKRYDISDCQVIND
jgi:hypothetical protein